ncbi:MAG: hypothetical protein L6R41_003987 [Letrouitia leprolyta]|nr:MAG: hypothetical protein L6R41_003987 [Letrouitia leprolyta]
MPVTINVADHQGRPWINPPPVIDTEQLFEKSCPREYKNCKQIIQSSFTEFSSESICGSSNGLVRACYHAYSNHHHLILRPEDIWFAILSQLSFHIKAYAEELRSYFVAHEGREELVVYDIGSIHTVDFGPLAVNMTKEMDKYLVDPALREWVLPDFSTTLATDTVTAAVLMMGAMQEYFSYKIVLSCGIPSVTLLGERQDWIKIQARLEKLPQLGPEPAQFAKLLGPVLEYFIRSFDAPNDPEVLSFWNRIAHQNGGSGRHYLSGWITAFCFWDAEGKCLFNAPAGAVDDADPWRRPDPSTPGCDINGTLYHRVDTNDIPSGYVSVPVTVDDNGRLCKTRMMAGSVGIQLRSSGLPVDMSRALRYGSSFAWEPNGEVSSKGQGPGISYPVDLDTIQPVSGWWMYVIGDDDDEDGVGGDDGALSSIGSQSIQKLSLEAMSRRCSKDGKTNEGWLKRKLQSVGGGNKENGLARVGAS